MVLTKGGNYEESIRSHGSVLRACVGDGSCSLWRRWLLVELWVVCICVGIRIGIVVCVCIRVSIHVGVVLICAAERIELRCTGQIKRFRAKHSRPL